MLLARGANLEGRDRYGLTALHHASMAAKNTGIVEALLAEGADIHARNQDHYTALHFAAEAGADANALVAMLIAKGAKGDAKTMYGDTPLDLARTKKLPAVAEAIGNAGGKPGRDLPILTLHEVGERSDAAAAKALLDGGAAVAELLLAGGAFEDWQDNNGKTPLDVALENDRTKLFVLLRQHDATRGREAD